MKIITNKDDLNIIIYKNEIDCDLKQKDLLEKYIKKIIKAVAVFAYNVAKFIPKLILIFMHNFAYFR